jgi:hypothetical protein
MLPSLPENGRGSAHTPALASAALSFWALRRTRGRRAERGRDTEEGTQKRALDFLRSQDRVFHFSGKPIWLKRFYRDRWRAAKAAEVYRESCDPIRGKIRRGPIPPRLPTDGRSEPGAGGSSTVGRDEADRPSDRDRIPPLCHRLRGRPGKRGGTPRRASESHCDSTLDRRVAAVVG